MGNINFYVTKIGKGRLDIAGQGQILIGSLEIKCMKK